MSEITALRCDGPDCTIISMPWEVKVRAYVTPTEGRNRKDRKHYCPDHWPYTLCSTCGKRMRPYQAKSKDWPDTVSKARSDPPLCSACYQRGWNTVDTKAKVETSTAQAARRVVIRHYQKFEADSWLEPAEEVLELLGL